MNHLRAAILTAASRNHTGHIPSALSILEIVRAAYDVMGEPDKFVLSKGHGALALYAVMAEDGVITWDEFYKFGTPGSTLGDHPDGRHNVWIEASTGSLGHGAAIACGMAYGMTWQGRVFCLLGDGETNEGSVWEAALIAARLRIANLTAIVDVNRSNATGDLEEKFTAFGWFVHHVDGHDLAALRRVLSLDVGPLAILAHTVKGKGVAAMEADPGAWHHRQPTEAELGEMIRGMK